MRPVLRRGLAGCLAVIMTGLATAIGASAAASRNTPVPADPEQVRAFLDARVPQLLAEQHIPGAAVVVVSEQEEIFAGGYGYANLEQSQRVATDSTAFRTASVGKSFTAVAVLQLVEAGELDLSADVNTYLPESMRVAATYPDQPVTLHHLLTHTAGFADIVRGQLARTADDVLPLAEFLTRQQPDRVNPPGRFVSYSNYGYDLAGYIVQEVSGLPFGSYLEQEVFVPLGMERSAYIAPAGAPARFEVPSHYRYTENGYTPFPPTYPQGGPSGATFNATAGDLGRFMRALLGEGAADGQRVLQPATVATMLSRHAGNHPALTGTGYGVWQMAGGGPQVFTNYGGDAGAHNQYALVPELDLGIYVATNGDGSVANFFAHARGRIIEEFLARFAGRQPYPAPEQSQPALAQYVGNYHTTRRANGEPVQLFQSLFDRVSVTAPGDGTLVTDHPMLPAGPWHPGLDGVFVSFDGADRLGFVEEDGEIIGLAFDSNPTNAYERIPWYAAPGWLVAAGVALLVLLTVGVWPIAALVRRWRSRPAPAGGQHGLPARLLAATTALACLGYVGFLGYGAANPLVFETGSRLQTVPLALATPIAIAVAVCAVLAWRRGWWSRAERVHYTAVAVASAGFLGVAASYGQVWTP